MADPKGTVVSLHRLLFSVDHPFSPNTKGRAFLGQAASVLDDESMEALTHGNAERVLQLGAA